MGEHLLNAAEICRIIKECGKHGVRQFKFEEICIEFGPAPALETEVVKESAWTGLFEQNQGHQKQVDPIAQQRLNTEIAEDLESEKEMTLSILDPYEWEQRAADPEWSNKAREKSLANGQTQNDG